VSDVILIDGSEIAFVVVLSKIRNFSRQGASITFQYDTPPVSVINFNNPEEAKTAMTELIAKFQWDKCKTR
jgi:hypothetical protein